MELLKAPVKRASVSKLFAAANERMYLGDSEDEEEESVAKMKMEQTTDIVPTRFE